MGKMKKPHKQQKRTRAKNCAAEFESWRNKRLEKKNYTLTSRRQKNGGDPLTYKATEEELKSFTQCYVSEKEKSVKYAKARDGFPEFWFISKNGTLLTLGKKNEYGEPAYVQPKLSGTVSNRREQHNLTKTDSKYKKLGRLSLDPAAIVCLVFGGKSTQKAQSLLNEHGLFAIKNKMVELHHIDGYKHSNDDAETRENRAYNCDLSRIQFEEYNEHNFITNMPSIDASEEKNLDYAKKLDNMNITTPTMFLSNNKKAGVIEEGFELLYSDDGKWIAKNNGGKEYTIVGVQNATILPKGYVGVIKDEEGNELQKEDLPEKIYEKIAELYKEKVNNTGNFDPVKFTIKGDKVIKTIYVGIKQTNK